MISRILFLLLFSSLTPIFSQTTLITSTTNQGYSDFAIVRFDSLATDSYDFDFDGIKFPSQNGYPTIYTIDTVSGAWYSINTLKPVDVKIKFVKFNVLPGDGTLINLTFSGFDLLEGYTLLHDTYLNVFQFVNSDSTYSFSPITGSVDRFVLMYNPKPIIFIDSATCTNPFTKIKLGVNDILSLDMMFDMYNSELTFMQTGHYNALQPYTSYLPKGNYFLKLSVITPSSAIYLNNSIKVYNFQIDTIPQIQLTINNIFEYVTVNQDANVNTSFSPASMYAELSFGDGTVIKPDSGSTYYHQYTVPGTYVMQLTVFDTVNACKKIVQDTIYVQSNSLTSGEFTQGKLFYSNGYIHLIPDFNITGLIKIYDISAKLVSNTDINVVKSVNYRLDTSNIASGIYLIEIAYNNKRYYKKIVKI